MKPARGNSGSKIQHGFSMTDRLNAMRDFYKGTGATYKDAAADFFKQHPNLK